MKDPDANLRGAFILCTAVTACFSVWILGEMWREAGRLSGSAADIRSPALFLWSAQLALAALFLQAHPGRTLRACLAVGSTPLPVWVLLGLAEIVAPRTLVAVHFSLGLFGLLLTGLAAVLSRVSAERAQLGTIAAVQVLCAVTILGAASRLWYWVSG